MPDPPEDMEEFPSVVELGGAIGRTATPACKQGQHDLCVFDWCRCRCHERLWYDKPLVEPDQNP